MDYDNTATCYQNGMDGRCGYLCEEYFLSRCQVGDEVTLRWYLSMSPEELDKELRAAYGDVQLFILRGQGKPDLDLLQEAMGYGV